MLGAPKPRRTANLAKSLDKKLNLYTLAARANCGLTYAAGVGVVGAAVMSLAPVAEAKIVYTPAHVRIPPNQYFLFDFDNLPKTTDADFLLARGSECRSSGCASGVGAVGYNTHTSYPNAVAATAQGPYAVALRPGERMGPHRRVRVGVQMAFVAYAPLSHKTVWRGQWANGGKGLQKRLSRAEICA